MNQKVSQRYQKALVTVAMGFRTEEDIKKNGLYRFIKQEKKELIEYISLLFSKNNSVLALKINQTGYRSEHININSEDDLNSYIPALVYTLYDGFYIYSPYTNVNHRYKDENGKAITDSNRDYTSVPDNEKANNNGKNLYGLKPYWYAEINIHS